MSLSSCRVVESSTVADPLPDIHLSTPFGHQQLNRHATTSECVELFGREQVQKPAASLISADNDSSIKGLAILFAARTEPEAPEGSSLDRLAVNNES